MFGADSSFGFYQNVYMSGYVAKTRTTGREGDDVSYRGNFNYAADRYGLQLDRTVVGDNFLPEVGFLPRSSFRRNFASARFSPRPKQNKRVRQYYYESSLNYTTDNQNRLESRRLAAAARMELQNSDVFHLEYFRDYELLRRVVSAGAGRAHPGRRLRLSAGARRLVARAAASAVGHRRRRARPVLRRHQAHRFDERALRHLASARGRTEHLAQLDCARTATSAVVRATGARTTFTMTPRMFVAALVQYASSSNSLTTNFRFRWEYQPGSELFVVYTDGYDTLAAADESSLQNRGLVVKVNKLVRF